MKPISLLALVLLLGGSGCARHYVMKLSNGTQIVTSSKPKVQGGTYYFKDASGAVQTVPQGRVREIAPASRVPKDSNPFRASPAR